MRNGILVRWLVTLVIVVVVGILAYGLATDTGGIVAGDAAATQFQNSNAAAVATFATFRVAGLSVRLIELALLVVLAALWWAPLRRRLRGPRAATRLIPAAALLLLGIATQPAQAYYDKSDYTEAVYVLPNQSAFLIPDTGANQTNQAQFMSEAYLRDNKVASKRVVIPHVKLQNSGTFSDFYVPAARLIVVDRTPFYREWVASATRGTSSRDESFRFESAESINIATGITIAAYVAEQDAAKFLYWFGTKPLAIDQSRPETQFQSVIQGVSLTEVMDTVVRGRVQAALANEFGGRTLLEGIGHKSEIMAAVNKAVQDEFGPKGITISYLGYAESLSFDDKVQQAINRVFVAQMQAKEAEALAPALPVLQAQVNMETQRTLASRWAGQLPNISGVWLVPSNLVETLGDWVKQFTAMKH